MGSSYPMIREKMYPGLEDGGNYSDSDQKYQNVFPTLTNDSGGSDQPLLMEMGNLSLEDSKQSVKKQNPHLEQFQNQTESDYKIAKALYQGIIDANLPDNVTVKDGYLAYKQLVKSYREKFEADFADSCGKLLGKKRWPCSPVWVALEMVLTSEKDGVHQQIYQKRLAVLKHVAEQQTKYESLPLRKYRPSYQCWFWCGLCCCCYKALVDVNGQPIHRAAQAGNLGALTIFMDILLKKHDKPHQHKPDRCPCAVNPKFSFLRDVRDGGGKGCFSPLHYALASGARDAVVYIITKEKELRGGCLPRIYYEDCCYDFNCVTCDKDLKEFLRTSQGPGFVQYFDEGLDYEIAD